MLKILQKKVEFKDLSRLLSDFPVLFKADLIFKDFSRKPSKFKYFSSQCEPCTHDNTNVADLGFFQFAVFSGDPYDVDSVG